MDTPTIRADAPPVATGLLGIGYPRVPADLIATVPTCSNCLNRSGTVPVSVFVSGGSGVRFTEPDSYCPPCADEAVGLGLVESP
jgi:hypothetical protein